MVPRSVEHISSLWNYLTEWTWITWQCQELCLSGKRVHRHNKKQQLEACIMYEENGAERRATL